MTMSRQKKREYMKDKDKERREKWFANLSEGIRTLTVLLASLRI
jgi:hypothetical protein